MLLADWQMTRMAPIAFDFFTMFLMAYDEPALGGGRGRILLEKYHAALCKQIPSCKTQVPATRTNAGPWLGSE
jgi:hypothetical protein